MNALHDPSQTLQDLIHVIAGDNNRQTSSTQTDSDDESFPFAVQNRDLVSRCSIVADTPLLTIAREHQLWNTDALADPFIQQHLFTARHAQSQKLVDHRAYFAAYVALRVAKLKNQTNQRQGDNMPSTQDLYLSYLPTAQDYAYHPVLQELNDSAETFDPRYSVTYALIRRRQVEWESEYAAFCTESPNDFGQAISRCDYLVARINVSSRAFTAGHDWTILMRHDISSHIQRADLDLYERYIDYNVQRDGIQVLVPVLDAHNHHPAANVHYDFDTQSLAFQFSAARDIPAGTELFINYGGRVDPWFYATYGFVNSDGSGLPGLSLAVCHTMYNERVEIPLSNDVDEDGSNSAEQWETYPRNLGQPAQQRQELQNYLTLASSGIQNVQDKVEEPCHDKFWEWKLEALQTIANDPSHWIVALPPLNPQAPLPQKSTNPYPKYKIQPETTTTTTNNKNQILTMYKEEVFNPLPVTLPRMMETALCTCRLLALTGHDNFDEHKAQLPGVISAPPPPPRTRTTSAPVVPDLETRAHLVLLRLVNLALEDYQRGSSLRGQGDGHNVIQPAVLLQLLASEFYGLRLTRAYAQKYLGLTT